MIDKTKAELETVYKISFAVSALDLVLATMCAANGNTYFIPFIVLAGLMWAYGTFIKGKAEQIGE